MADSKTTEQPRKQARAPKLPEHVRNASNSSQDADVEAQKKAGEQAVTDETVETGGRRTSVKAIDPTKVKQVGSTLSLRVGDRVELTLESDRVVTGNVMGVHPGTIANDEAGIPAVEPTVDVKAFTGNPDTGGHEEFFGVPVSNVTAQAEYR